MKNKLLATLAASLLSFPAIADTMPDPLARSLNSFSFGHLQLSAGVLKIAVDKPLVTLTMFENILTNGVCLPLLLDEKKGWGKANIERIEFRNQIQAQGFAINGARKVCTDIGAIEGGAVKVKKYLAPITLVCVAGAECRARRPGEKTSGDE